MISKLQKWGNSLGLRIPQSLAREIAVAEGTSVELRLENGSLRITPVRHSGFDLSELLSRVTPATLHDAVDTGPATGREVW